MEGKVALWMLAVVLFVHTLVSSGRIITLLQTHDWHFKRSQWDDAWWCMEKLWWRGLFQIVKIAVLVKLVAYLLR